MPRVFDFNNITPEHIEWCKLVLQALDLSFKYNLQPSKGENDGLDTIEARQEAALKIITWALGRK